MALPSASSTKINPKISTDLQAYAAVNAAPLAPLALSFTVDRNDDNPSATLCTVAPNDCSLRGAIIAANANLGADTIIFDPATNGTPFTLTAGPADNEFAGTGATQASGDLDIVDDLTITGNGAALTVIDGNNLDRIIDVNNFNGTNTSTRRALTVVIDGVTLRNGDAKAVQVDPGPPAQFFNHSGGAIRFDGVQAATTVRGSLTVTNSIITTNRAAAQGGGIQAINCSLTLNNDQVLNNQATTSSSGGVLYNAATTAGVRTLTITNSTISNNRALTAALGSGGGINIAGTATVNINGNTIAGNQAGANGGGIFANVSATTAKTYSKNKITGNSANQGGAIFNTNGSLALNYNLIVGNSTTALVSSSFHSTAGTVTATDDWWGCNQGPNNPSSLCDKMTGAVEPNYLVLRHNATPNTILVNTSASLQADFYTDSAGAVILPVNLVALEGRPIVFNNAVLGTISGADTQISNGKANATYTAGSTGGTGSADATVDHATVTAFINIQAAAAVTVNPTDQTACEGGSVTFTAASSGFPPPTVQWQVSSGGGPFTDIPGATSNTLTFTANISQDGNKYRAVFTNAGGSATSSAATLTVNSAPTVTTNPTDATVCAGAIASFTAAANGKPAPSVQWQVSIGGGPFANLPGETNNTLSFTASAAQNGNKYRAVFSNTCGSANTTAATLTVNGAASTTDPADKTVCQGAMASFSTTASGTGPFHYAWTLDGSTYDGDSASITVDTTSLSVGNHSVVVTTTGACGSSSQTATLTVQENTATSDPADSTVCQGATASFSTTASGTGPFHYAWTLDGSPFNGDSSSINVPTGSLSVGSHSVTVTTTGVCGSASQSATLTVQANTTTTDPADATLCQGATASFSTTAGGTGPFSYAWTIDGSSFGGDTSTINVPTGSLSVGFHTVTVTTSGACASASQSATLTVQENTTATTPNDQTVCQGATAGFSTT
ncbi:MAG TPA: hypothetical protein DC047_05410, partial [Blastocatellia bacterium]|nr:hypothetical protein [Blastocatellia bacterium]